MLLLALFASIIGARADQARVAFTDSVRIQFNQSKWDIDRSIGDNDSILSSIHHRLNDIANDSVCNILNVRIYGGASPEGGETGSWCMNRLQENEIPITDSNINQTPRPVDIVTYCKPFYMDIRSNMLYDALLLPNIGVDFYIGKNLSVGGNWMYGWWSGRSKLRLWRAYGGEVNVRWWPKAQNAIDAGATPFRGHHIGAYGQIYTYDFRIGNHKGQLGGKPNGTLFDSPFWSAGIEYGYALPISNRLSIDFSIGIGYSTGIYHTYTPDLLVDEVHYIWNGTHRRKYFGPTKAEVALVWLIGNGNTNNRKVEKGGGHDS